MLNNDVIFSEITNEYLSNILYKSIMLCTTVFLQIIHQLTSINNILFLHVFL